MLWLKALAPAVVAVTGVGAFALAKTTGDPAGPARVWIDGPRVGSMVEAGSVTVTAHATASSGITGLRLIVDGQDVSRDDDLQTHDLLAYGKLTWRAAEGTHQVQVRQVGGAGVRSDVRLIEVRGPAPTGPIASPSASASLTPSPSASPTASVTPSATPIPTPTPSPTPTAGPAPQIASANFVGTPLVYTASYCAYAVTVRATTRNATAVSLVVDGTSQRIAMSGSGGSWTATIRSGFDPSEAGQHQVSVYASGTSTASRVVGTLTVRPGCPKD